MEIIYKNKKTVAYKMVPYRGSFLLPWYSVFEHAGACVCEHRRALQRCQYEHRRRSLLR